MVSPLLKWIGNKQRMAASIVGYMPEKFNNYYEPFLGSGAVLAELLFQRKDCLWNNQKEFFASDILPFLIDIFKSVQISPDELSSYYAEEIACYNDDPENYYLTIRERFNQSKNYKDFCVLTRTCYSGIVRFRKKDGYMSTPRGPHKPISGESFRKRVITWNQLIRNVNFLNCDFIKLMDLAKSGDVVYCDPPYTHSQNILYGAQSFDIKELWEKITECKNRGVFIMVSINKTKNSQKTDISAIIPEGLFERKISLDCGTSMIDRLQNNGKKMTEKNVHDYLLLTW